MKRKYTGLTMVELITVVAIIALLMGLLIPSIAAVRRLAKEVQQKAQLSSIEMALEAFKEDNGSYPPSNDAVYPTSPYFYGGAQKLTDALFGRDLIGFYPNMNWSAMDPSVDIDQQYLNSDPNQRKDVYLHKGTFSVFQCGKLFATGSSKLAPTSNVICDVFGKWPDGVSREDGKVVRPGVPILYYRAGSGNSIKALYSNYDNILLAQEVYERLGFSPGESINMTFAQAMGDKFYYTGNPSNNNFGYIQNPEINPGITGKEWPYNPDSFLLISAGPDGIYGNADDITNFR